MQMQQTQAVPAAAVTTATSGADLALLRALGGLSLRSVSSRLGVSVETLRRWETSREALSSERAQAWQTAIAAAMVLRRQELARQGISLAAIPPSDLARALHALYAG